MLQSPSKRRKLSPPLQTAMSVPGTPNQTAATRAATRTTPSRPSFASPTKASLSRHNPQLLERLALSGGGIERSPSKGSSVPFVAEESLFIPQSSDPPVDETAITSENPISVPEISVQPLAENEGQPTLGRSSSQIARGSLSAPPRRRLRTPGKDSIIAGQTAESNTTEGTADIRETDKPTSPIPFRRSGLRRSPVQNTKPEQKSVIQDEPDLPLTPTQRGLEDPVVTTPPTGIHNTPSKRTRTRVSKPKPSPLKSQLDPEAEKPLKRRKEEPEVRDIQLPDPHAEKKRLRDELLQELQQLEVDVVLGAQENQRLREHHHSGKGDGSSPPNADEIHSLLLRTRAPTIAVRPKPPSIFQSLGAFLPFSAKPRQISPVETGPLPSHLPLHLDDPLPHLKAFTNLKYTSIITLVPTTWEELSTSTDLLKQHAISIRSPEGLFYSRLNMTVNTKSYSVAKLTIDVLDPNAEPELGQWARNRASGNGVLGRDVSAICWAMGQWHEVAIKRARFWCTLEREFGSEEMLALTVSKLRDGKRKRKRQNAETEIAVADADENANTEEEDHLIWPDRRKATKKQLQRHIKRTAMALSIDGVELTIKWAISFDWTGEAESNVSASVRISSEWQDHDERGSFSRVPMAFEALVRKHGPVSATRAMAALLARE